MEGQLEMPQTLRVTVRLIVDPFIDLGSDRRGVHEILPARLAVVSERIIGSELVAAPHYGPESRPNLQYRLNTLAHHRHHLPTPLRLLQLDPVDTHGSVRVRDSYEGVCCEELQGTFYVIRTQLEVPVLLILLVPGKAVVVPVAVPCLAEILRV